MEEIMLTTLMKKIFKKNGWLLAILFTMLINVTPGVAAAQEETYKLDPIIVAGEKEEEEKKAKGAVVETGDKSDNEPKYSRLAVPESSKAATEVFTRDDIEKINPKSVIEIIEQGLGVITNYKGRKDINNISGRGGESIGIIIDGIYIPWSQSSRVLANIPVNIIESVKLVRDSTVLTLGPITALTLCTGSPNQGFVIIKTRKSSQNEKEVNLSYGTYNTQKYNFLIGDKINDVYYDIAYSKAKTDGKDDWHNARDSESVFLKSGYNGKDINANMSLYIDKGWRELQRGINEKDHYGTSIWEYDPLDTVMFSFNVDKQMNEYNTTSLSCGYSNVDSTLIQHNFSSHNIFDEEDYIREYNLFHTIIRDKNTLKFGGQAIHWHSPTGAFNYEEIERKEDLYGYYLYDEYQVNQKLTVDGSARVDKKHIIKGVDSYRHDGKGLQNIDDVWASDATSYSLGMAYKVSPVYKVSTRVSYSKQPPDEYSDGGLAYSFDGYKTIRVDNGTDFDPEKRLKYEIGVNANYNKAFNSALTLFYYDIDDYKIAGESDLFTPNINDWNTWYFKRQYSVADLVRKGLEWQINGRLLANTLAYNFGYSYLVSSNDADNKEFPHNIYTLRLSHTNKYFETALTGRHVGGYLMNAHDVGDFTTVDASITKKLGKNSEVILFGQNITNEKYATIYAVPKAIGAKAEGYFFSEGAVCGVKYSMKF
jgi:outer membrane cobalamin receptor